MMMKKFNNLCSLILLFSPLAIAREYEVKKGDTLSQIAKRLYPEMKVYGRGGSLEKLINKNSQIKNPNLILSGLMIDIKDEEVREMATSSFDEKTDSSSPVVIEEKHHNSPKKIKDKFYLGFNLGPRFYSQNQTGAQGTTKGQTIFGKNIDFSAGYLRENVEGVVKFGSYQMDFDSSGGGQNKQLYRLNPKVYYKNFFLSALYEEVPLFQFAGGVTKMSVEAVLLPGAGYRWVTELNSERESRFELEGEINYLASSGSNEREIKITSARGYGARLGGNFVRRMDVKIPLYYSWANSVHYRSLEREISWGANSGKVKSTHLDFSSMIGLQFDF